jgi:antitoxin YobK
MEDLDVALSLIRSRPDLARFVGPREEALVVAAEEALGRAFPPTYRRFVRELGAGSFGTCDLYGVIDDNFDDAAVPNGIWHTLTVRQFGLPAELILISESADGIDFGLDTSQRDEINEAPVVEWTARGTPRTIVATDFGRFLLDNVRMQLDR